jgi:hypothetical protein
VSALLLFSRCLIGVVFAVALFSKLRGFRGFVASVRQLDVVPGTLVRPVAVAVVVGEAAVAIAMVVRPLAGFAGAVALLGGFAAAVAVTIRRGTPATCHCFGASGAPFGRRHVVRNLVLAACAATGAVLVVAGAGEATGAALAIGVPAALVAVVAVVRLDDLMFLFTPARPRSRQAPAGPVRAVRPTGTR